MPLIVPGIASTESNQPQGQSQGLEWMNKLMGKTITDSTTDATVRTWLFNRPIECGDEL